jgi:CRP/FNR family cyclic AMP-dependent transcriptional regulator
MTNFAALWHIESVNLFNILCHHTKVMGGKHEFKCYAKNQFVYFPGDESAHIYMIAGGRVRIGHNLEDGKEVTNAILSTGEIFGELAIAGENRRTDFAQVMDNDTAICPTWHW